ncbi:MAG: transglycosylase domain-containing protein [Proteobacteria bacterium]|nr:transglycosylase domain-containing protein [Pseudomonadota bacterium]
MVKLGMSLTVTKYVGIASIILAVVSGILFVQITKDDPKDVAAALKFQIERVALPSVIYDRSSKPIGTLAEEARYPVRLSDVPLMTQRAFLASEDVGFFRHSGVSWRGIIRSAWVNILRERVSQGGSTITQQLVRQYLLSRERSFSRKIREINLALRLERQLSKKQILELWLNGVYLGNNAWGIEAASQHYFRKSVIDLTSGESAVLAGLPQAPGRFAPHLNPAAARIRKNYVLRRMEAAGWLDRRTAKKWIDQKIDVFRDRTPLESASPWITDATRSELWRKLELHNVPRSGLAVETGIDRDWQKAAENLFEKSFSRFKGSGLEGAFVAVDVATGEVRSMIGALDNKKSQFNRSILLSRPFGSATFPLIFARALDDGVTMLSGGQSLGLVAIKSSFMAADRAASAVGYGVMRDYFMELGLKVNREDVIEQVQGSPLALALAWRILEGRPLSVNRFFVKSIRSSDGKNLEIPTSRKVLPGISEAAGFSVRTWLSAISSEGNQREVVQFSSDSGWNHWEIAMNHDIVAVMWIGADKRPTTHPEIFAQMRGKARPVMTEWLTSIQGGQSPTRNAPPTGISWQILKDPLGRSQHVPFPTMTR